MFKSDDFLKNVLLSLRDKYFDEKLDHERGGIITKNNDKFSIREDAIPDSEKERKIILWSGDMIDKEIKKADDVILWHTHPVREMDYEPPSGYDISSAMNISYDFKQNIHGVVIEKKGYWSYSINYNDMIKEFDRQRKSDPEFFTSFDVFVEELQAYGDMHATFLNFDKDFSIKYYGDSAIDKVDVPSYLKLFDSFDFIEIDFLPIESSTKQQTAGNCSDINKTNYIKHKENYLTLMKIIQ